MGSNGLRLVIAVWTLSLASSSCVGVGVRAYVGFMQSETTGDYALDTSSGGAALNSIEADVENILGINNDSPSLWAKAEFDTPELGRITASAFRYDESGNGTLGAGFGDIPSGTAVSSELTFNNLKAAWTFDALDIEFPAPIGGGFRLSPGVALNILDIDTRVNSASGFEDVDTLAGVPMLYLQSSIGVSIVALDVEAGWMNIDLADADGEYFDLEGMLRVNILPKVELVGGYRFISIDSDGDADGQLFQADLKLHGWYVGAGFAF